LWHAYFLFLQHSIVSTQSIKLRQVINATHNEPNIFFTEYVKQILENEYYVMRSIFISNMIRH